MTGAPGLMQRLKEGTADLHAQAEKHPFQTAMVRGTTTDGDMARWLGQMLLIHDALERSLLALRAGRPELASVIRDDLFQAGRLREDLAHHGVDPATVRPLRATAAVIARIDHWARERPAALLGALYVLEGSKNGNRFIARALQKRMAAANAGSALAGSMQGLRYLDPHGEAQRPLWLEFRQSMDGLTFDPGQADAMLDAARDMFRSVTALSEDLVGA